MNLELKLGTCAAQVGPQNPRVLIGRDETKCELHTPDASVSRRHAEVYVDGGTAYIRDLGSSNGTWVDGTPLGQNPMALAPGQMVFVGHAPLGVEFFNAGGSQGATVMGAIPPEIKALMDARRQQQMAQAPMAPVAQQPLAGSPAAHAATQAPSSGSGGALGVGGTVAPEAAKLTYRRQGSNNNGTLLIALPGDTFNNDDTINGFLEFTATDKETVASIFIELVEVHKKGPKKGHVWDRHLVRQGPWKTKKGDVLPMEFKLRVPSGPSLSGPDCHWELRGYVDIDWALDVEATLPINMRNTDIEKIRDGLGSLDYRINVLDSKPLGQKFTGKFNPPANLQKQLNLTDINLDIEYLGSNLKVTMVVEKSKLFHFDKKQEFVFDLQKLRAASVPDVARHFQTEINKLMNV